MLDWRLEARERRSEIWAVAEQMGIRGANKGKLFPAQPQEWGGVGAGGAAEPAAGRRSLLRGLAIGWGASHLV